MPLLAYAHRNITGLRAAQAVCKDLRKRIPSETSKRPIISDINLEIDLTGKELTDEYFATVMKDLLEGMTFRDEQHPEGVNKICGLHIQGNKLTAKSLIKLSQLVALSAGDLRELDISHNRIEAATVEDLVSWQMFLESFGSCYLIKKLDLGHNPFSTAAIELLAQIYMQSRPEHLENDVDDVFRGRPSIRHEEKGRGRGISRSSDKPAQSRSTSKRHLSAAKQARLLARQESNSPTPRARGQSSSNRSEMTEGEIKLYSRTRGLASIPYLILSGVSLTKGAAIHIASMVAVHRSQQQLLAYVPPGEVSSLPTIDDETRKCDGLVWLPDDSMALESKMLELAVMVSKSESKDQPGNLSRLSEEEDDGQVSRVTYGNKKVDYLQICRRVRLSAISTEGAHSMHLWTTALLMMAVSRAMFLGDPGLPEEDESSEDDSLREFIEAVAGIGIEDEPEPSTEHVETSHEPETSPDQPETAGEAVSEHVREFVEAVAGLSIQDKSEPSKHELVTEHVEISQEPETSPGQPETAGEAATEHVENLHEDKSLSDPPETLHELAMQSEAEPRPHGTDPSQIEWEVSIQQREALESKIRHTQLENNELHHAITVSYVTEILERLTRNPWVLSSKPRPDMPPEVLAMQSEPQPSQHEQGPSLLEIETCFRARRGSREPEAILKELEDEVLAGFHGPQASLHKPHALPPGIIHEDDLNGREGFIPIGIPEPELRTLQFQACIPDGFRGPQASMLEREPVLPRHSHARQAALREAYPFRPGGLFIHQDSLRHFEDDPPHGYSRGPRATLRGPENILRHYIDAEGAYQARTVDLVTKIAKKLAENSSLLSSKRRPDPAETEKGQGERDTSPREQETLASGPGTSLSDPEHEQVRHGDPKTSINERGNETDVRNDEFANLSYGPALGLLRDNQAIREFLPKALEIAEKKLRARAEEFKDQDQEPGQEQSSPSPSENKEDPGQIKQQSLSPLEDKDKPGKDEISPSTSGSTIRPQDLKKISLVYRPDKMTNGRPLPPTLTATAKKEDWPHRLSFEECREIVAESVNAHGTLDVNQQSLIIQYAISWEVVGYEQAILGEKEGYKIWKFLEMVDCFTYSPFLRG